MNTKVSLYKIVLSVQLPWLAGLSLQSEMGMQNESRGGKGKGWKLRGGWRIGGGGDKGKKDGERGGLCVWF